MLIYGKDKELGRIHVVDLHSESFSLFEGVNNDDMVTYNIHLSDDKKKVKEILHWIIDNGNHDNCDVSKVIRGENSLRGEVATLDFRGTMNRDGLKLSINRVKTISSSFIDISF